MVLCQVPWLICNSPATLQPPSPRCNPHPHPIAPPSPPSPPVTVVTVPFLHPCLHVVVTAVAVPFVPFYTLLLLLLLSHSFIPVYMLSLLLLLLSHSFIPVYMLLLMWCLIFLLLCCCMLVYIFLFLLFVCVFVVVVVVCLFIYSCSYYLCVCVFVVVVFWHHCITLYLCVSLVYVYMSTCFKSEWEKKYAPPLKTNIKNLIPIKTMQWSKYICIYMVYVYICIYWTAAVALHSSIQHALNKTLVACITDLTKSSHFPLFLIAFV